MRLQAAVLVAALTLAAPASAHAVSYATNVRVGHHPKMYVRTVVDFPAWAHPPGDKQKPLSWWQYSVRDNRMYDGRGVMRIRAAYTWPYTTWRFVRRCFGLTVRVKRIDDRVGLPYLQIELTSKPEEFVSYTYTSLNGRKAVIDSWIAGRS